MPTAKAGDNLAGDNFKLLETQFTPILGWIGEIMPTPDLVSLREAQFILGRPEKEIGRAIERGDIDKLTQEVREPAQPSFSNRQRSRSAHRRARRTGQRGLNSQAPGEVVRKVRKLGTSELVYLWIERELHSDLTPAGRRKLYEAIKAAPSQSKVVVGPIEVPLKSAVETIRKRYRELMNLRSGIVEEPGKEPTIKGVGISVYLLAALAQGESTDQIIEDYPGVTRDQIDRAVAYAAAYPKKGRPYPTRSFKRMLEDAANAGVFDFEPALEEALADSDA